MTRTEPSHGHVANPRNADHLSPVVDGGSCRCCVSRVGQRRKFYHFPPGLPDHRAELQDLKARIARRIVHAVLSPAHNLAEVVGSRRIAVVPAGKRRQWLHRSVSPAKAITYFSRRRAWGKKGPTRKCFAERIILVRIGDSNDQAEIVLDRPG